MDKTTLLNRLPLQSRHHRVVPDGTLAGDANDIVHRQIVI